MTQDELFKTLVAHCKEYGFIFPSSEIYDRMNFSRLWLRTARSMVSFSLQARSMTGSLPCMTTDRWVWS